MSLKTWRDEFYPTRAFDFHDKDINLENKLAATEHSLQKWRGLLPENLKKHRVRTGEYGHVEAATVLPVFLHGLMLDRTEDHSQVLINSASCSLCVLSRDDCRECPIVHKRGRRCDVPLDGDSEQASSEWHAYRVKQNPKPMIKLLENTRAYLLAQMPNPSKEDENSL